MSIIDSQEARENGWQLAIGNWPFDKLRIERQLATADGGRQGRTATAGGWTAEANIQQPARNAQCSSERRRRTAEALRQRPTASRTNQVGAGHVKAAPGRRTCLPQAGSILRRRLNGEKMTTGCLCDLGVHLSRCRGRNYISATCLPAGRSVLIRGKKSRGRCRSRNNSAISVPSVAKKT